MSDFMVNYKKELDDACRRDSKNKNIVKMLKCMEIYVNSSLNCLRDLQEIALLEGIDDNDFYTTLCFIKCNINTVTYYYKQIKEQLKKEVE